MRKYMSSDSKSKVVQTRLTEKEYDRLRKVAEQEDLPLKEVLRKAAMEFSKRQEKHDPEDPFFAGSLPESPDDGESLTATKTDEYLYQ